MPDPTPLYPADSNLLFGILALQMDFISRDALIAAMNAWVLEKTKPLGQILVERGALRADNYALLEPLVQRHLEMHGNDAQQSLAAVSSIGSVRDELQQIADPDLHASLDQVSRARSAEEDPNATRNPSAGTPTSSGRRFRILRPHARGGLGQVYVAHDEELNREVALKEIQDRHADSPDSRSRFLVEAEITGRLEHPGIVPVYGLGHYLDGRPFYAMRFIHGDSLSEAITRFHKAESPGRDPGERTLALRELLGRFIDVCDAIAYAHSRGVLHRDLKPGNIMLGKYGETLVVDWGLAKPLEATETVAGSAEGPIKPSSGSGLALTQTGQAVGTPQYMSPEQAGGQLDQLGPASDVYSLGATLYCLLTGHAPVEDSDIGLIFRRVQQGDFTLPRQLNSHIPVALEAICLKAMAREPADRYASPDALRRDVQRWLADEPVSAYREPWARRLGRWRRKHSTLVTATALVLLTVLGGVAVGAGVLGRERARERVLAQVEALPNADPAAVQRLLEELEPHRDDALARLREQWADQRLTDSQRLRVGVALLPVDGEEVRPQLIELLGKAEDPQEVLLVRDALLPYQEDVRPDLWTKAKEPTKDTDQRNRQFRLLVVLATLDPENPDWTTVAEPVTEQFLAANPLHLGAWKAALKPVRLTLVPPLVKAFRASKDSDRGRLVASVLADYASDLPDKLVEMLVDADERQYAVLLPKLKAQREGLLPLLYKELDKVPVDKASDAEKDVLAERHANAAVTLLHLGEPESVWPLLQHTPDSSRRTHLLHKMASYGIGAPALLRRLEAQPRPEVSERRALLLGLGEYPREALAVDARNRLVEKLLRDYRDDPDAGIHAAVEWLLRRWQRAKEIQGVEEQLSGQSARGRQWYVNQVGQTLTIIPADQEFLMGSPEQEPDHQFIEVQHRKRIPRSYAIGAKEVTVAQFRRFLDANPLLKRQFMSKDAQEYLRKYSPDDDGPMIVVNWFQAAQYCNWLSQEEGLEVCYPALAKIGDSMQMPAGYLEKSGYRLPTEAEWEYACRAGAVTSRFYGTSEKLLGKYAWYTKTTNDARTQRGGLLKPNDLGLFDIYGNVGEWCQDGYAGAYERSEGGGSSADRENGNRDINDDQSRILRGGGFSNFALQVRSAYRDIIRPSLRAYSAGFRVARTYR